MNGMHSESDGIVGLTSARDTQNLKRSLSVNDGNAPITATGVIQAICAHYQQRIYVQIPLSIALANLFIKLFRLKMAPWDKFCLDYRHFTYPNPVSPAQLGLPAHCQTVSELLRVSGINPD